MLTKVLTIINTLAIIAAAVWFFNIGLFDIGNLAEKADLLSILDEKVTEIEEMMEEEDTEEMDEEENEEEEEEHTLEFIKDSAQLEGFVDLTGYTVTESETLFGEEVDLVFFSFTQTSDDRIKEFIDDLVLQGNTVNRKSGSTYFLGLGCDKGERIESLVFDVEGSTYDSLMASSSSNPVSIRAFFGDIPETGGACISYANGLQMVAN